ncbi:phosphoserine phosphatase SerB [Novosphingobium sp.]|uniref:phosphoserine phosphatase SerB n=1 Tax=Novosphingobium sp. TaxID=1874826 RepID=UPI003B522D96
MLIVRLIADTETLGDRLAVAMAEIEETGAEVVGAGMLETNPDVLELEVEDSDAITLRRVIEAHFGDADLLIAQAPIALPGLFVSDMDSTMIGQECIDELADFAGLKPQIAAITERAMRGEMDFGAALRERVALLKGLPEVVIKQCLDERIRPMAGAATLVRTLKAHGAHCVLVTGGFHAFADPVAQMLGFDRVVGNHLAVADGVLTGEVSGAIVDGGVKRAVLAEETARLSGASSLATGDGANDIPMLIAATCGIAFHAKPKAREAADGRVDQGDLTAILDLYGIPREAWVMS